MYLGVTGDSGTDSVTDVVTGVFFSEFASKFWSFGTRTDEAHFAAQDVPELGKFIETQTTQVGTDFGTSWVVGYCPDSAEIAFGVLLHGAEFDDGKSPAVQSDSNLTIENGAAIGKANRERDNGKKRRQQHQAGAR
jgi:hypothetical protein